MFRAHVPIVRRRCTVGKILKNTENCFLYVFRCWTRNWFLTCTRLYCRLPSILPGRHVKDVSFPAWTISAGLTLQSVIIRVSEAYCHCHRPSRHRRRLLNLPERRRKAQRWQSVGPALFGQVGKETPYILPSGPGSSVAIATDYGLDGPGSNPVGDEISRPSRPALDPTQPPVQWVPGLSRG